MLRLSFITALVLSLMLFVGTVVLMAESRRRNLCIDFHDQTGGLWEASFRDGSFMVENQTALRLRTYNAAALQLELSSRRAAELHAQWQRRPDRFEKITDGLMDRLAEAQGQELEALQRSMDLKRALFRSASPPVRHSVYWGVVVLGTLVVPSCWPIWIAIMHLRRARRRRNHRCVTCGYDLRASSGRCPECGTAAYPSRKSSVSGV